MIPMQWSAHAKLPYYGWFGNDGFVTEAEARSYIAKMLRHARSFGRTNPIARPSYSGRQYYTRRHLLQTDDSQYPICEE